MPDPSEHEVTTKSVIVPDRRAGWVIVEVEDVDFVPLPPPEPPILRRAIRKPKRGQA